MQHPFEAARSKVARMREQANLLTANDKFAQPYVLLQLAVGELEEYHEEHDKQGTPSYSTEAARGEFDDIAVFYFSWLENFAPKVDMLSTIHTANGYGRHSAALDQLAPVILDSADDPRAIPEVIARLASVGMHMPVPYVALEHMDKTTAKVLANRPPQLFTTWCPIMNRHLAGEEIGQKYEHLNRGTRLIRNAVNRTLRQEDWRPHIPQLVDWTQSD